MLDELRKFKERAEAIGNLIARLDDEIYNLSEDIQVSIEDCEQFQEDE